MNGYSNGITCFLTCVCALVVVTVAGAQDTESTVLVRRVVPTNFHDADFDTVKFQKLLTDSVNRVVVAKPNSSLSSIIKDEFNISQSWTPAVYDQLEAHVRALNNIQTPTLDLKLGQMVKLPDLPRTAQIYLKQGRSLLSQTKSSIATNWNSQVQAFSTPPKVSTNVPGTAATELQIRMLPVSALGALQLPSPTALLDALIQGHEYQVMQEHMELTLSDGPEDAATLGLLSQAEKASLKGFLARPVKTKPILVILDDGYPSQSDFFNAAEFVIKASREIRQKFGLQDATHKDSPTLLKLEQNYRLQGTMFCDADCEYPKLKMHSAMIRESLRELMEIDTNQRVEVIYLPVNEAQPYSQELLTEILSVALLADSVTDGLVLKAPGIQPPADKQQGTPAYSSIAPQVEAILRPKELFTPLSAYTGGVMISKTDRAIIDGIVNFLWLYSMASQRPHFLSMSWTAHNLKYPVLFRPNGYGLWLAAAGNDPKVDIHKALNQFAARSSDPGDVLAVENVASACDGSTFTTKPEVPVFGFAFPGRISPDLCGTSFSTPRIAWFLAAYEAIKGEPVKPYDSMEQWRASKRHKLMALQSSQQTGEARYKVSPWQLLEESIPK